MNTPNGRLNFQYKFSLKKMGAKFSRENLMNKKWTHLSTVPGRASWRWPKFKVLPGHSALLQV